MDQDAQELTGGNASAGVVRIGHTVRKPWVENSGAVQDYLAALRSSGLDVPQPLGGMKAAGRFSNTSMAYPPWTGCRSAGTTCCAWAG